MSTTRYIIDFVLTTQTPTHVGSGFETKGQNNVDTQNNDDDPWVSDVQRDVHGRPCIPGSSLKGVLRRHAVNSGLECAVFQTLFGSDKPSDQRDASEPGNVEFYAACVRPDCTNGNTRVETRTAIDRITGTVVEQKLFSENVVQPGTCFHGQLILKAQEANSTHSTLGHLLTVLKTPGLQIGAHTRLGWGQVNLEIRKIRIFTPTDLQNWSVLNNLGLWTSHANVMDESEWSITQGLNPPEKSTIELPIDLQFSGPFAVRDSTYRKRKGDTNAPDTQPRHVHGEVYVPLLPASSFMGSLRSHAERILRTLGQVVAQGHEAAPFKPTDSTRAPTDLVAVLFGCPGWRGVLEQSEELRGTKKRCTTIDQDMLAICRITGGGKDGAKFKLCGFVKPRLKGKLVLNLHRIPTDTQGAAKGLLYLLLRDLTDGCITFGMGRAKGWGWVDANPNGWQTLREKIETTSEPQVAFCLKALWEHCKVTPKSPQKEPLSNDPIIAPVAPDIQSMPHLLRSKNDCKTKFHNPYHFLPFTEVYGMPGPLAGNAPDLYDELRTVAQKNHHAHNVFYPDSHSGTITVSLTTITPFFIGGSRPEQTSDRRHPVDVPFFQLDGKLAIPGTSLRGMLSQLLEPMLGSAMRQINAERLLSVRSSDTLPEEGTIVLCEFEKENGQLCRELGIEKKGDENDCLQIAPDALEKLYALADERWAEKGEKLNLNAQGVKLHIPNFKRHTAFDKGAKLDLLPAIDWQDPNHPTLPRNDNPEMLKTRARLMVGQKIYFRRSSKDSETAIEIAWSSRWRSTAWADPEWNRGPLNLGRMVGMHKPTHLPLGMRPDAQLHHAEWVLGVVEHRNKSEADKDKANVALAFASKIAIGFAVSDKSDTEIQESNAVILKELSEPKPPSPALYFKKAGVQSDAFVSKRKLISKPQEYELQGTKYYLHAHRNGTENVMPINGVSPWKSQKTDPTDRQVRIRPVKSGETFNFEIRFTNLCDHDLAILFAALSPSDKFEHKLGMGKPIGLGSVKLKIEKIHTVDHGNKYSHFSTQEHIRTWCHEVISNYVQTGRQYLLKNNTDWYRALLQIGEPEHVTYPVHYPQVAGDNIENENFKWWMENERIGHQNLKPLPAR